MNSIACLRCFRAAVNHRDSTFLHSLALLTHPDPLCPDPALLLPPPQPPPPSCPQLIDKYMDAVLEHKRLHCKELVPTDRLSCVRAVTRLFDSLAVPENGVSTRVGAYPC